MSDRIEAARAGFSAGHAIGLHLVIELARQVPLTGDALADKNITNAIARAREVQRWLEPLAHVSISAPPPMHETRPDE